MSKMSKKKNKEWTSDYLPKKKQLKLFTKFIK